MKCLNMLNRSLSKFALIGKKRPNVRNSLVCIIILAIGCSSLKDSKEIDNSEKKIIVLSTIAMIGDLVSEIGKEHVVNTTLIKSQLDPHSYELVKGDDEKFVRADVIFSNGLGLEHGYSLRHNLENNSKNCFLGDTLLHHCPELLVMIDKQYDPHIWMDIALWMQVIDPIVSKLSDLDPIHAEDFKRNGQKLKEKMLHADQVAFAYLQAVPSEKRYLVTSHNAFNYFAKHYLQNLEDHDWQERLSAPEGLAPEAELSPRDLMRVIDYVQKHQIFVLFAESNVNKEALKKIVSSAREKGLDLRIAKKALYVDSMGDKKSYLEMMEHNVHAIAEEILK